jgi:hypothetical protein
MPHIFPVNIILTFLKKSFSRKSSSALEIFLPKKSHYVLISGENVKVAPELLNRREFFFSEEKRIVYHPNEESLSLVYLAWWHVYLACPGIFTWHLLACLRVVGDNLHQGTYDEVFNESSWVTPG